MMGRAALRCKKKNAGAAARIMNLGRGKLSTLQQRIPRMKEHTSTGYGTAKSEIKLSRTHRTCARERTKTDRVTAPKYPKSKQHRQQGVTDRRPTRKCEKLWLVSCKDCVHHADLQQPKRSSPRQKWNCL